MTNKPTTVSITQETQSKLIDLRYWLKKPMSEIVERVVSAYHAEAAPHYGTTAAGKGTTDGT